VAVVVEAAVSCVTAAAGCSNGALQALVSVLAFALASADCDGFSC
jgi:hypothetical protein